MRVRVFIGKEGILSVLVEPSRGKGLVPVVIQDVKLGEVVEKVGPTISAMRGEKFPIPSEPR